MRVMLLVIVDMFDLKENDQMQCDSTTRGIGHYIGSDVRELCEELGWEFGYVRKKIGKREAVFEVYLTLLHSYGKV